MEVLLFDNQISEMELMAEILVRIGCQVTLAYNEYDCYEKIKNKEYGLLIFDHDTPGLDVSNFVMRIEHVNLLTPVAMMATLPSKFYEKKYGYSGIDFLIFKPFGLAQVSRLVEDATEYSWKLRKPFPKENRYQQGDNP